MALTRAEIRTLIESHLGRVDKTTLINSLCANALKAACQVHNFNDACAVSDIAMVANQNYFSISGIDKLVSVRVIWPTNVQSWVLTMKDRRWWDENIVNENDENAGQPSYGLRFGTNVYMYPVPDLAYTARVRSLTIPSWTTDIACPISCLDLFIEAWVTSKVFKSIEDFDNEKFWMSEATDRLNIAISFDEREPSVEDTVMTQPSQSSVQNVTVVRDLTTDSPSYGDYQTWI
jgi:hypothetical protein